MSDDNQRSLWELNSPRGPALPTPVNPYGSSWAEESEPEIDVMEYVRLVWAKKWLVLGVLVATVAFATAWSLTRPKMYRASTKIALQPPPQLSNNQFDMAMSWYQMDRIIADQVEILKTRELAGTSGRPPRSRQPPVLCRRRRHRRHSGQHFRQAR